MLTSATLGPTELCAPEAPLADVALDACNPKTNPIATQLSRRFSPHVETLWNGTVTPYLLDDLWIDFNAYDAGHHLMVPLHAAFYNGTQEWRQEFSDHFARLVEQGVSQLLTTNRLSQFQYLYLASRFLVLSAESQQTELVPAGLDVLLYDRVKAAWETDNANQWGQLFTGFRERLSFKLADTRPMYDYHLSIRDDDLFLIAMAADLRARERILGITTDDTAMLAEIMATARLIFQREVVRNEDGGWVLQPGYLTEHPDFAYAGHETQAPNLDPAPRPGGSEDNAHFHRVPLVITSLIAAHTGQQREMFVQIRQGLARQFLDKVLTPPTPEFDFYRTRNYMDGHNGLYRYNGATTTTGSAPYGTSSTMLYGWWTFLDSPDMRLAYREMANRFPLTGDVLDFFERLTAPRVRHPLVDIVTTYHNGFRELLVTLAGRMGQDLDAPKIFNVSNLGLAPRVSLKFNEPVVLSPNQKAIIVTLADGSPILPLAVSMSGDDELKIDLSELAPDTQFRITVLGNGDLVDEAGNVFDGDSDGQPSGDLVLDLVVTTAGDRLTSLTADGAGTLTVNYEIVGLPLAPFEFELVHSFNPVFDASDEILSIAQIDAFVDLQPGVHAVNISLGDSIVLPGAGIQETATDYYILGVIEPSNSNGSFANLQSEILSGVYHIADGPLMVFGSDGDDDIYVDVVGRKLEVGGLTLDLDAIKYQDIRVRGQGGADTLRATMAGAETLTFFGGNGSDVVIVNGSPGDEFATIYPDWAMVTSGEYRIEMFGAESVRVAGNLGYDTARLFGSTGFDQFYAKPAWGSILGTNYQHTVTDFESLEGFADGDDDRAYLYAEGDGAIFNASPIHATLTSSNHASQATGFARVYGFADNKGADSIAYLSDSPEDDFLVATPEHTYLSGSGFYNVATGFNSTSSQSSGGVDFANLFDSAGNDLLEANPNLTRLSGKDFQIEVEGFAKVLSAARVGGDLDRAVIEDSPGPDVLNATPSYSRLSGDGFSVEVDYFDKVVVRSSQGGATDTANFFDSGRADTLLADPTSIEMSNGLYHNRAIGFERANAYAGSGEDSAVLNGSPGDDILIATPTDATFTGDGFSQFLRGFDRVTVRAGAGGLDRATFKDSAGDEDFVATTTYAFMSGEGFYREADYFEEIVANASGGKDVARLYASPSPHELWGDPKSVRLVGGGSFRVVNGFDRVVAYAGGGSARDLATLVDGPGPDDLSATPVYARLSGPGYYLEATRFESIVAVSSPGGERDVARLTTSPGDDDVVKKINRRDEWDLAMSVRCCTNRRQPIRNGRTILVWP